MSNYTFLVKNANSLDRQMIKVLKAAIKKKGCAFYLFIRAHRT